MSSRQKITPARLAMLLAIERYVAEHGYAPTVRELSALCGKRSLNGTAELLEKLKREGYIEWARLKSRTIRVLRSA